MATFTVIDKVVMVVAVVAAVLAIGHSMPDFAGMILTMVV